MGDLPTARPRTYVNGMPAIPDDINNIFDAIIRGAHGPIVVPLDLSSAALFNVYEDAGSVDHAATASFRFSSPGVRRIDATSDNVWLGIPLNVPSGTTITNLVVEYDRNGSASVTAQIARTGAGLADSAGGTGGGIFATHSDTTSVGTTSFDLAGGAGSDGTLPLTANSATTLRLEVGLMNGGMLYGAFVTLERL